MLRAMILVSSLFIEVFGSGAVKIVLEKPLIKQLNICLSAVAELHLALINKDNTKQDASLQRLEMSLTQLKEFRTKSLASQVHLKKILDSVEGRIMRVRIHFGAEKIEDLKEIFRQIVELANTYEVDKYWKYYCHKDKGIWLQKSRTPQNPFNPEKFPRCGVEIK